MDKQREHETPAEQSPERDSAPPPESEPSAETPEAQSGASATSASDELAARIAILEDERKFYLEQLQRARADFDNFRKRTNSERAREQRRTRVEILREMLPIYDGLRLSLTNASALPLGGNSAAGQLCEGVRMLAEKFDYILERYAIEAIEATGVPFDPHWHEAVLHEESDSVAAGHVLAVLETGYRCGEELLRPARVTVAKAPVAGSTSNCEAADRVVRPAQEDGARTEPPE